MHHYKFSRKTGAVAVGAVVGLLLAACGGGGSSSTASDTGSSSDAGTASTASLDSLFKGTEGVPPTSAPAPAKGKTVYWISCGQQSASCAAYAAAGKAAGEAIGWTV